MNDKKMIYCNEILAVCHKYDNVFKLFQRGMIIKTNCAWGDFLITDFVKYAKWSKGFSMEGYHPANRKKKKILRGYFFFNEPEKTQIIFKKGVKDD